MVAIPVRGDRLFLRRITERVMFNNNSLQGRLSKPLPNVTELHTISK